MSRSCLRSRFVLANCGIGLIGLVLLGCGGGGPPGPERFALSGTVTFNGQPVPVGFISFTPDAGKGNSGPGTGAAIKDGKYATEKGKGTIGGPHRVKITGYDGVPVTEAGETLEDGTALFAPWEFEADLPKQNATENYEVPADKKL